MSNYKKLYGVMNMTTGYLMGANNARGKQYAYCKRKTALKMFENYLRNSNYRLVELRPILELGAR